ncbi:hypothetical protein JCM10914_1046 [Paenibacillus sp. JCM 10914]|nr:hypothetical protein JCM10914_1046 [Paenibacillus sp. JCM 10914]
MMKRGEMMKTTLKYRNELKFFVNAHQHQVLRQRLKNLVNHDQHAGPSGEYHIRSLYFDDINNKALHEKLAGVRDRVKYRIRIYNVQDSTIHFEKKIKFRDYIAKQKVYLRVRWSTRFWTDNMIVCTSRSNL